MRTIFIVLGGTFAIASAATIQAVFSAEEWHARVSTDKSAGGIRLRRAEQWVYRMLNGEVGDHITQEVRR